jgi:glucose-1-phosphate thymidylyltransferase
VAPVGVIPAAGHAQRLQPLPCSKEVYPVGGRPVMDYVVERMRAAGCERLRVVTRAEKNDVVEHAAVLGAEIVIGEPPTMAESIALGLEGLEPHETVLVGLPDTIWEPIDGFVRLLEHLDGDAGIVLGLFESAEPERSDVVVLRDDGSVESVHVKEIDPPGNLVWGCFAGRAGALAALAGYAEPGHFFAEAQGVRAVRLESRMLDIGTHAALAAAEEIG